MTVSHCRKFETKLSTVHLHVPYTNALLPKVHRPVPLHLIKRSAVTGKLLSHEYSEISTSRAWLRLERSARQARMLFIMVSPSLFDAGQRKTHDFPIRLIYLISGAIQKTRKPTKEPIVEKGYYTKSLL